MISAIDDKLQLLGNICIINGQQPSGMDRYIIQVMTVGENGSHSSH